MSDFIWATSELANGHRVKRLWWPKQRYLEANRKNQAVDMHWPNRCQFVACRGDINANDWVRA